MNNGIHKIKAFTVNEMLVVLLITSLVVGMAFSVLQLVQRQMYGISGNYEKNTELNLLRQSLWIDFNRFDGAWYDPTTQELVFANELRAITYQFQEELVIKERDTFRIKILDRYRYFNGESKFSGEIDALDLYTSEEDGGHRVFVFKRNSATSYINQ